MAPKRSNAAGPSTPTKKQKQGQQQSLNAFLTSPGKVKQEHEPIRDPPPVVEDGDALFALQLAAQEAGCSIGEMRRRLGMAKPPSANGGGSSKIKTETAKAQTEALPTHPLFAKRSTAVKDEPTSQPNRATLTPPPTSDTPVAGPSTPRKAGFDFEALDADIASIQITDDVLIFDPQAIPTKSWPRSPSKPSQPETPYALLSHAFITISSTKSRLLITTVLTNLIRIIKHHDPENLIPAIYLITNHIAPNYDDVQLGIGGAITNKAIKDVTGKGAKTLKQLWDKTGDPGDVAYEAKKDVHPLMKPNVLTVRRLFASLHTIASTSGPGSATIKTSIVTKLLVSSRGEEARWLVRTFHSHLRIGAVKKTLSSSLARAFSLIEVGDDDSQPCDLLVGVAERKGITANPTKAKERQDPRRLHVMAKFAKAEKLVREVFSRHPNFTSLLNALSHRPVAEGGLPNLSRLVPLRVGVPLSPMLGSITRSLTDVYTKLGIGLPTARAFVSEFKYDGQRVQIHAMHVEGAGGTDEVAKKKRLAVDNTGGGKWSGDYYVRLFSRHLESMTSKYPDIVDLVPLLMSRTADAEHPDVSPISSFIIDAEVVAIGPQNELLPFQTLSNRSRKDVQAKDVKVKVGVYAFDLMYLDGKPLLKASFRLRRRLLHTRFPVFSPTDPLIAKFDHVKSCESNEPDEVEKFFEEARNSRCEGIMVKTLDHHYQKAVTVLDKAGNAEVDKDDPEQPNAPAEAGEMQQLDEFVSDDLSMEEDDAALQDAVAKKSREKGSTKEEEDAEADIVGKGVTGRGKALLSTYEPDKRCESWLKVKRDYVDGIGDSLDLVPIGAWHGMGRKAAWWSPILLAVRDSDTGQYVAVCKCISGFTDAEYKDQRFRRFVEDNDSPDATCYSARSNACRDEFDTGGYLPDVWFKPNEVWEIRGADVTLSPVYPAAKGLVSEERGLSLRFPRYLKTREDKSVEEASTPEQLAQVYFRQNATITGNPADDTLGGGPNDEDEEGSGREDASEGKTGEHDADPLVGDDDEGS